MSRAQIVFQPSDRSGLVSSLRPLRPCLKSQIMFWLQTTLCGFAISYATVGGMRCIQRESSASCILVIRLVIHEISYIQPIHWWNFRFTFWQHMSISSSSLGSSVRPQHSSQSWSPNLHARDGNFSYDKEWSTLPPLRNLLKIRCIPGVA